MNRIQTRPLKEQVLVVTGGSSGIGPTTARMAARRGATVILSARNEEALQKICSEIVDDGGKASYIVADVSDEGLVNRLAERAMEQRGRIDSWINAAAVPLYGELHKVPVAVQRQLFEINYWGTVYGSLAATLRVQLERNKVPVSVTLIKPTSVDTPYTDHARNYLDKNPVTPPPRYAPEIVARAILHTCTHPVREVRVGGGGLMFLAMGRLFPRLYDWVGDRALHDLQTAPESEDGRGGQRDNLYQPKADGHQRGQVARGRTRETSLYTTAQLYPLSSAALLAGGAPLAGKLMRRNSRHR